MTVVNQASIDVLKDLITNLALARAGISEVMADELYNPNLIGAQYAESLLSQISTVFEPAVSNSIRQEMLAEADYGKRVLIVLDRAMEQANNIVIMAEATLTKLNDVGIKGIEFI